MDNLPEGWEHRLITTWNKLGCIGGFNCSVASIYKAHGQYGLSIRLDANGWKFVDYFDTLDAAITFYEMAYG